MLINGRLEGKVALVTGSATGIGEAVCRRFAEEGAAVIVTDRDTDGAIAVADSIVMSGGRAEAINLDVTDVERWSVVMDTVIASYQAVDILVNNAGIGIMGSIEDCTLQDWRQTQAVNGEGVFLGAKMAVERMKLHGGSIINISSVQGMVGDANAPAYNYSKGGVRVLTKSVALHCAALGYSIRVNSVHPGYIGTRMVEEGLGALGDEGANVRAGLLAGIPMGKFGEPSDVADGCLFLASAESKYMTGSELVIDGGYTCR